MQGLTFSKATIEQYIALAKNGTPVDSYNEGSAIYDEILKQNVTGLRMLVVGSQVKLCHKKASS